MTGEKIEQAPLPPVCEASLAAMHTVFDPVNEALSDSHSVIYTVLADRAARAVGEARFGVGSGLVPDPARRGLRVPRHQVQGGSLPEDARVTSVEHAIAMWTIPEKEVPKLRVPPGEEPRVMALADAMQMRGGGPVIFERAEAGRVPCTKRTLLKIDGGARNALNERIETALSYVEASGYVLPIVATVDPSRILDDKERAAVASFAPSALNEQELFIDSALSKGFTLDAQRYGARHLPDGSSYVTMRHAQSGAGLVVLSPHKYPDETTPGKYRNGVYNGYQALIKHGADLPGMSDFVFEGSDMVVVTGTHYGAMSVVNNLYEAHDLRVSVGSYHVIGDNQPESSRKPQAHLIEQGYVIEAIDRKSPQYPAIRAALFPQAA